VANLEKEIMDNKKAKVLIVDDLRENLYAMKVTLSPLDAEIHTASSGNEALSMMIKQEYAVILLDVQMPEMDGFEAAQLMQNNKLTRGVPIIFVTAISKEKEHVFKGYEAGAVDYLFKPVNPDILVSKVQVFINLHNIKKECEEMHIELQKSRNLESLGVLAGGIAHDFNNILAAIMGNIDLVILKLNNKDPEIMDLLANAEKATIRAKDLTYQLLTFSKGGLPVKTLTSIDNIIRESADFVLHGSNVRCRYDFADDLWPAEIDRGQVGQVIQNIVLNAIHAMPDGGNIELTCNNFVKKSDMHLPIQEGRYVEIKISDKGIGISEDKIGRIFDPYMTTKKHGHGLGLAITYSIIKKHEGHIIVNSEVNVGTTFTIYLPASENPQAAQESPKEFTETGQCLGKIMVMDDEEMIREFTTTILLRACYHVVQAKDGAEAIKLFDEAKNSEEPVDVSIMDLTIPGGVGGKEAVVEILKIDPGARVIVSSGYSNDPVVAAHKDYGFCASISKPYQLHELLDVVKQSMPVR
jgi:signal transduction histidine kinase